MLARIPLAGAPYTCLNFVNDKQPVVLVANLADAGEVVIVWYHHSSFTQNGFHHHRNDVIAVACCILNCCEVVVWQVDKPIDQWAKAIVNFGVTSRAECRHGAAMKAAIEGNYLRCGQVFAAGKQTTYFYRCLVGLSAGIAKENGIHG